MKTKQTFFFSSIEDITPLLKAFESTFEVKYAKTGLFANENQSTIRSVFEIEELGTVKNGDWNKTDTFMILPQNEVVAVRSVPQRKGGMKYAVDQAANCNSIIINVGGICTGNENVLVAGRIGTISKNEISLQMYKHLAESIKRSFTNIDSFYVGNLAIEKLRHGWRLVTNERLSEDFDLKYDFN